MKALATKILKNKLSLSIHRLIIYTKGNAFRKASEINAIVILYVVHFILIDVKLFF